MISIDVKSTGDADSWLRKMKRYSPYHSLHTIGMLGIAKLAAATPKDRGITAGSWHYEIVKKENNYSLIFENDSMAGDSNVPIVILIQYGHALPQGTYVSPNDFINPVIDELVELFDAELENGVK